MKTIQRTSQSVGWKGSRPGIVVLLLGVAVAVMLGGLTGIHAAPIGDSPASGSAISSVAPESMSTPSPAASTPSTTSTATSTVTTTATSTPTSSAPPTPATVSVPTAGATAVGQQSTAVADHAVIENFPSLAQSYHLSCEYAAASAVTLYWGNQVTEQVFLRQVPRSPNPHLGFRGDITGVFGGINDYGVYAEPLVPVLQEYDYNASVFYGGVNRLKANVAAGNPVIVWITTGKYTVRTPVAESYNGNTFTLVPGEHALVIYGYDSGGVYMMNVADGGYYYTEWASFLTRWSYFDQMALVITPQ